MAISTKAAKAKGRQLQQLVAERIKQAFPSLDGTDAKSTIMGDSGEDVKMTRECRAKFPFSVECKRYAKFSVYKIMEQAQRNAPDNAEPLVVIRGDNQKALVVIDFETFMRMWDEDDN